MFDEHRPVPGSNSDVAIPVAGATLPGRLRVPEHARGIIVFAHGSGSSRHSPRNQFVADVLYEAGLGTLLFDLLTADEERDRANVFDIGLLAGRLVKATRWLRGRAGEAKAPIGYFGASTGGAAALWGSVDTDVAAVVSRGGRPDLAAPRLPTVTAPTLLIVGGSDPVVLDLNRQALSRLTCTSELAVVPGATHLFEEPGALQQVAELARDWFLRHLETAGRRRLHNPGAVWDTALDRAREDAEGTTVYEGEHSPAELLVEREEAQGVDVFELPEAITPPAALKEGAPGHETYAAEQIRLEREDEDTRDRDQGAEPEALRER